METNVSFDPVDVRPFGMDGVMEQAHHAVDLIKNFWILLLTLHVAVLYCRLIKANLLENHTNIIIRHGRICLWHDIKADSPGNHWD